jgi:hypothetical protein
MRRSSREPHSRIHMSDGSTYIVAIEAEQVKLVVHEARQEGHSFLYFKPDEWVYPAMLGTLSHREPLSLVAAHVTRVAKWPA